MPDLAAVAAEQRELALESVFHERRIIADAEVIAPNCETDQCDCPSGSAFE
jgi:hypothetical protein